MLNNILLVHQYVKNIFEKIIIVSCMSVYNSIENYLKWFIIEGGIIEMDASYKNENVYINIIYI